MNIIEVEDQIKGLPDEVLIQKAQQPDGQMPTFLVVSELQRRADMRKRYQAQEHMGGKPTVKDQVLQQGIASVAPRQQAPSQTGMPAMPGGTGQPAGAPMRFATGGQIPNPYGRSAASDQMLELASRAGAMGASREDVHSIIDRYLPPELRNDPQARERAVALLQAPDYSGTMVREPISAQRTRVPQWELDGMTGATMPAPQPDGWGGMPADPDFGQRFMPVPQEEQERQMGELFTMSNEELDQAQASGYSADLVMRERQRRGYRSPAGELASTVAGTAAEAPGVAFDWLRSMNQEFFMDPAQVAMGQVQRAFTPRQEGGRAPAPAQQPAPSVAETEGGIMSTVPDLDMAAAEEAAMSVMPGPPSQTQSFSPMVARAPEGAMAPGGQGAPASRAIDTSTAGLEAFRNSELPDVTTLNTMAQQDELDSRSRGLLAEADDMAKRYLSRAEAQGEEITEEAKDDAFNLALMSLGVGIGRGDVIGGLEKAGAQATETVDEAKKEARQLRKEAEQAGREERRNAQQLGQRMFEQKVQLAVGDKQSEVERSNLLRRFAEENRRAALGAMVEGARDKQTAEIQMRRLDAAIEEAELAYLREQEKQASLTERKAWEVASDIVERAAENGGLQPDQFTPRALQQLIDSTAARLLSGSGGSPEELESSGGWGIELED